jgi:hypothetical protein
LRQVSILATNLLQKIAELSQQFKAGADGEEDPKKFRNYLIILCYIFLGGQRPQVIEDMTIDVSIFNIIEINRNSRRL